MIIAANTALLLIDVQKGLDAPSLGQRNNLQAEANMALLLQAFRDQGRLVVHIKHDSLDPNSSLRPELPGNEIKAEVAPLKTEKLFSKTVNSAFIGTQLESYVKAKEITDLVVVGLTTEHCVSTSVRMAANLGFNVYLVEDAVAAHEHTGQNGVMYSAQQIHDINIASLSGEFCQVVSTEQILSLLN